MALILDGTTGFSFPTGTTAQRPATAPNGSLYINTTTNYLQTSYNNNWFNVTYLNYLLGIGGTITTVGDYKIHTFTTSGVFSIEVAAIVGIPVEVLVVAGGGAGGQRHRGGGGAGGVIYNATFPVSTGSYAVTVGAGGTAPTANSNAGIPSDAAPGSNSVFATLTAFGGGGAGPVSSANGGSGAGAVASGGVANPGGFGTVGQGNNGGAGSANASSESGFSGGGGGGANSVGGNSSGGTPGAGGTGSTNPIVGSITGQLQSGLYYIAGGVGGGGNASANIIGAAGLGGGGAGGASGGAGPGTANTGGGGGCGGFSSGNNFAGGNGGSGVVIIRYKFQ